MLFHREKSLHTQLLNSKRRQTTLLIVYALHKLFIHCLRIAFALHLNSLEVHYNIYCNTNKPASVQETQKMKEVQPLVSAMVIRASSGTRDWERNETLPLYCAYPFLQELGLVHMGNLNQNAFVFHCPFTEDVC